jgi:hypothetical protein
MKQKWILSLSVLSLAVGAQLLSLRAEAQVVCGTLAECRTMESQTQATLGRIQARIRELEGSTGSGLGDILRDANGRVRHMNQYDAERTCREQGTRLPTARELAVYSQSLGARGIRETAHPGVVTSDTTVRAEIEQMDRDGYYPIYVANSSGQRAVDFYFNYSGYQRPAGALGNLWFLSSSVHPGDPNDAYSLVGGNGVIYYDVRSGVYVDSAVRCVR